MKVTVIQIEVGAIEKIHKGLVKGLENLDVRRQALYY